MARPTIDRLLLLLAGGIFLALSAPSALLAGVATGTVTDGSGEAVYRARVMLFTSDLAVFEETRTDPWGRFFLKAPNGTYTLGLAARGYGYLEMADLTIEDLPLTVELALGPETEPGFWETVGESIENLGASNSASLLADGRVFFCHDTRDGEVFDPAAGAGVLALDSNDEQGCSAVTLLSSGELLFVGGQQSADFTDSTDRVKSYDPAADDWIVLPSLNAERWYPALARLPGEGLLVCGGGQRPDATRTETCERWDPLTREWRTTSPMVQGSEYSPMALLHTGEVLKTWFPPELYDPAAETWRPTGPLVQPDRIFPDHSDHSLVVLRDGQAVALGFKRWCPDPDACSCCVDPSSGTCPPDQDPCAEPVMTEHFEPCDDTWRLGGTPETLRLHPEVVPLPNGRILAAGGELADPSSPPTCAVSNDASNEGFTCIADLYDPAAETWRAVAPMRIPREYHTTSFLLPDARVLVTAGGGAVGLPSPDRGVDLWSPPYLLRGPRPVIEDLETTELARGQSYAATVSQAEEVTQVVLLGVQATTHYVDGAVPRRVALGFEQTGAEVTFRVSAAETTLPLGWYLLFVMVDDVPSEGRIVKVTPPADPVEPDRVGAALRVVRAEGDVLLQWRRGPLFPSRYNLYRRTLPAELALTPGGIGDAAAYAALRTEAFTDEGAVGPGEPRLWYYRVLGRACDGSGILP